MRWPAKINISVQTASVSAPSSHCLSPSLSSSFAILTFLSPEMCLLEMGSHCVALAGLELSV